jgi:hypothetical protein
LAAVTVRVRRRGRQLCGYDGEGDDGAGATGRARAVERSSTDGEEISRHGLGRKVQEIGSVRDLGM